MSNHIQQSTSTQVIKTCLARYGVIPNPVSRASNEPYLGNLEGLSYVPKPYEAPEFVKDEEEDEYVSEINWEFTSDDVLNFLLISKRLKEFNGCLKLVSNYIAGYKEYLSIGYGENDEVRFKCHYKNEQFDGLFSEWYENGQIKLKCNYLDGQLDGHLTRWWEDGERMLDSDYIDGALDGDEILHNESRMMVRRVIRPSGGSLSTF